jgi:hypothetical protein
MVFWKGNNGKAGAGLIFFLLFTYLLVSEGRIISIDGLLMYKTARGLVDNRSFEISPSQERPWFGVYFRKDSEGRRAAYAKYGPGLSILAAPFYVAGKFIRPLFSEGYSNLFFSDYREFIDSLQIDWQAGPSEQARVVLGAFENNPAKNIPLLYYSKAENIPDFIPMFMVSFTAPVIISVMMVVIFFILVRLGYSRGSSVVTALLIGILSPVFAYSKNFFSDPLAGLCLVGFAWLSLRPGMIRPVFAFLAGLFLGYSFLARPVMVLSIIPALIALFLKYQRKELDGRAFVFVVLGVLPGFVGMLLHNHVVTGSFFQTGYGEEAMEWTTPLLSGVSGLLFSPGKGLFWFCPLMWLSIFVFPGFWRRSKEVAIFSIFSFLLFLLVYSKWYMWEGGWCWGPRFLVAFIPLILLPVVEAIERFRFYSRRKKILVVIVLVLSGLVSFNGILVNWASFYNYKVLVYQADISEYEAGGAETFYEVIRWYPSFSPLFKYWSYPNKDYFIFLRVLRTPDVQAFKALGIAFAVGWLVSGLLLVRLLFLKKGAEDSNNRTKGT